MRTTLLVLTSQLTGIAALGLYDLGIAWIDIGAGFHPMAAGMAALLILATPYLIIGEINE